MMSVRYILINIVLVLPCSLCVAVYPSLYPFNHEIYKPNLVNELPRANPSFNFDSSDPGGYFRHFLSIDPFSDQYTSGPFAPPYFSMRQTLFGNFFDVYYGFQLFSVNFFDAGFPHETWNCTNVGLGPLVQSNFPGFFFDRTICSDCCSSLNYFNGFPAFGSNFADLANTFGLLMIAGGCGYPDEELYCEMLDVWTYMCVEYYQSPTVRNGPMLPCYDSFLVWLLTCYVYKAIGFSFYVYDMEPPMYTSSLTNLGHFYLYAIEYGNPDRACFPYSYWHPDAYIVGTRNYSDSVTLLWFLVILLLSSNN